MAIKSPTRSPPNERIFNPVSPADSPSAETSFVKVEEADGANPEESKDSITSQEKAGVFSFVKNIFGFSAGPKLTKDKLTEDGEDELTVIPPIEAADGDKGDKLSKFLSPQPTRVASTLTIEVESDSASQPILVQTSFDSPLANKAKKLSSHAFKCSCEPSSEPYACERAYNWLQ